MFAAQSTALEAVSARSVATRMRLTSSTLCVPPGSSGLQSLPARWGLRRPSPMAVTGTGRRGIVRTEPGHAAVERGPVERNLDDDELVLLSRVRPEAFGELYDRHAQALLRFFARRTFDPDVAAELTAETFAQAFVSRMKFVPQGGGAAAWLYGIAKHQLSRFHRRGAVDARARKKLGLPPRQLSEEDYDRIEELMDTEDVRGAVADAFRSLSPDQQEAVNLRVVEGRPYEEVAAMTGATEQTARARVSRGLRRLGSMLEEQGVDGEQADGLTPVEMETGRRP